MRNRTTFFVSMFLVLGIITGTVLAQQPAANVLDSGKKLTDDKTAQVSATSDSELSKVKLLASNDAENQSQAAKIKLDSAAAAGDLMSFNFRDIDIRQLISALAMKREINVVMSKDVSGKVSVHLYQVNLEQALDAITLAGGFTYKKHGDLYYVYKPPATKGPQVGKLDMWAYKLKYGEVEKIQEILDAFPEMHLIKIHEPSKTVIVQDTPENIAKIKTLLGYLDATPRQVIIEAKILNVTLTDDMSLGVNWEKILGDARIGTGGFSTAALPTTGSVSPVPSTGSGVFANVITATGTTHQFSAALDALQSITKVDVLSTPKILAIHGKQARVQVGGQQGYKVTTVNQGVATETIEFIDTGTILEITPYINEEGSVLLNVKPRIQSAEIEQGIPVVRTTDVSTWLLANDGETVMIGGLIQDTKTNTRDQIPVLGSIPIIGWLFGRTVHNVGKSELVVLITSQIVDEKVKKQSLEVQEKVEKREEKFKKDLEKPHKDILDDVFSH